MLNKYSAASLEVDQGHQSSLTLFTALRGEQLHQCCCAANGLLLMHNY